MFNIGPFEVMVILVVALLVVGPRRLPEVGRSIGRGLREFRKAQDEVKDTLRLSIDDEPTSPPTSTEPGAGPTAVPASSPQPSASSETTDVARTLGKGLAELRKAREEVQRTFRVELSDLPNTPSQARPPAPARDTASERPDDVEQAPPAEAG